MNALVTMCYTDKLRPKQLQIRPKQLHTQLVHSCIAADLEAGHPDSGVLVGERLEEGLGEGLGLLVERGGDGLRQLAAAGTALLS